MARDITILIGGKAGQGIQTIGAILAGICHDAGLFVFSVDDFESRIRGGHSFHLLRVSAQPLIAPCYRPDILVAIDGDTYKIHKDKLAPNGIVVLNKDTLPVEPGVFCIPFAGLAREAGGTIASNTVAAGAVAAVMGAGFGVVKQVITRHFAKKGETVLQLNLAAAKKGVAAGSKLAFSKRVQFERKENGHVVMTGAKAAALGALAADCRFFPFYPMSPGTAIITHVAAILEQSQTEQSQTEQSQTEQSQTEQSQTEQSQTEQSRTGQSLADQSPGQLPVVIEQAEDEIAAVNMAIGASYTGVRSLVATSGGGFSLMVEGLGLSAITETPVVIINAQRPGPATGLATRTAQADLLFSIHASQDDFPRFVFAPGSVLETYKTVKKAVFLSEKYQVPAIVLMDQFLADSAQSEPDEFDIGYEHVSFLVTDTKLYQHETYERYRVTNTGISPRCVPGHPHAMVRVAGNEHTVHGIPSEDPKNRNAMVEKRDRKRVAMEEEMSPPLVFCENSEFYLTGWGSSKGSIMEACLQLRGDGLDVGWIIFEDIWPLNAPKLTRLLSHKKMIMVEGNAQSQLGTLIRSQTGLDSLSAVLKYDGRPMYPAFIIKKVKQIVEQYNGKK